MEIINTNVTCVTFETRVDVVDKSQASEIQTEADDSNVSERPHSDKPRLHVCTVCDKTVYTERKFEQAQEMSHWRTCVFMYSVLF